MSILEYDGRPRHRKFFRETQKIGWKKPRQRKPRWMEDIEEGVSHFLCPEVKAWLPKQGYDVTLEEKRENKRLVAEQWLQGLSDGTYRTRAGIARANKISRARITQLINAFGELGKA